MKKQKRRQETEDRLLIAVGEQLRTVGVVGLTIKQIAAHACVDKALIYRYFGNLDGLLAVYAETADFWPSLEEVLGTNREALANRDPARRIALTLANFSRGLRARPHTLALLGQECVERTALTTALEAVRERRSGEFAAAMEAEGTPPPLVGLVVTLFAAAINYLSVRSQNISIFAGLPIADEEDWARIHDSMEAVLRAILTQPNQRNR